MTSPHSGKASIEIVADASRFAASVRREVNKALREVHLDLKPISNQIAEGLQDGVDRGERAIDGIDDKAQAVFHEVARDASRSFAEAAGEAEAAADSMARSFQQSGERAERAFREMDRTAGREFTKIAVKAKVASKSMESDFSKAGKKIGDLLEKRFKTIFKGALKVGAAVSLVSPLTIAFVATLKAVAAVGRGIAALGTVTTTFLPSLLGSIFLVVKTFQLVKPALSKAFEPMGRVFHDANGEATAVTKTLQDLASRGIEPLARAFVKVNMPSIIAAMDQIAIATNFIVASTLRWINTAEGQRLVGMIAGATADAFFKLAPKINDAAIALGRLALRAGDRAIVGLGDLIGRLLDKFTAWANNKSVDDINASLERIKGGWAKVKEIFNHVRDIVDWIIENQDKIKTFGTIVGIITLIGGLATGNFPAAIIAGLGLLLAHWDKVVKAFKGAKAWWDGVWNELKDDPVIQRFVAVFKKNFEDMLPVLKEWWQQFETKIIPKLKELWRVIHDDLIPALTDFGKKAGEFVKYMTETFGPSISEAFADLVDIVKGAVRIIAGLMNILTAIIDGDTEKIKQGISQVARGILNILQAVGQITLSFLITISAAIVGAIAGMITETLFRIARWGVELLASIRAAWNTAVEVVSSFVQRIIDWILGLPPRASAALSTLGTVIRAPFQAAFAGAHALVSTAINGVISLIVGIPGRIAGVAGQMAAAGVNIMRSFINGLTQSASIGNVAGSIVSAVKGSLNSVINRINAGLESALGALPGNVPKIPTLATGGLTQQGGLAQLHPKELVLPLEDQRAVTLLAKALKEADAGLRAAGVATTGEAASVPEFDVLVFIGDQELKDQIDIRIVERDRSLRQRVQARTGARR